MQEQLTRWKPKIEDTETNPGTGELLRDLVIKLKAYNCEKLKDDMGNFALNLEEGVFVTRRYIWGNIVSCHKRAVVSAINQNKPLIMYIKNVDKFYEFNPREILEEGVENRKGEAKFINFSIRKGRLWKATE